MSLFVDHLDVVRRGDSSDVSNALAKGVLSGGEPLVTSDKSDRNLDADPASNRAARRRAVLARSARRRGIRRAMGAADLESAWQIGLAYRDQDFSIVEPNEFRVMRRLE